MQTGPTPRFVVHKLPQTAAAGDPKLAVRRFISQVGGIENARQALDFLALLDSIKNEKRRAA